MDRRAWQAPAEMAGQRLDKALAAHFEDLSRSRIKALIDEGRLFRNGQPLKDASATVREGDVLELQIPPPVSATPQPEDVPFTVLYEDESLIVLDKPAGLVVHPAPGHDSGTLVNGLLAHCGDDLTGIGGEKRPGIVHRLDKDTSGVMVVAKNDQIMASLCATFAARDLDRVYVALCWGVPASRQGEVDAPIGRDPKDRKRMAVVKNGKTALTRYRVLETWFGGALSLVECRLATGRTHQIRVHMASINHPVVGDPVYLRRIPAVAKSVPPDLRASLLDFPRQALHARRLGFKHPVGGNEMLFESDMPPDFSDLLESVRSQTPD